MSGIIMLIVYAALMIFATVFFTKKPNTVREFHIADRNMGIWQSAFSIAATWIWAPALFVSAERAYIQGIPGLFWFLVPNVLCLILFIPFAKKIRSQMPEGITLSGFMNEKYGRKTKNVYLFQLSTLSVLSTGVNLLAGGAVLSVITNIPFFWITVILAAIAYSYSQFSGIKASVFTDFLQMILILIACFIFVPWALQRNGIKSLIDGLSGPGGKFGSLFSHEGIGVFFAFGLSTTIGLISGPFGDQNFWQRAFSIKEKKIAPAFILGAVAFGLVPLSMGILGYIARGSGFVPANAGMVNLEIVTNLFPAWTVLPFIFMIISGLLSTVDSNLCSMASLTMDITKSEDLLIPKGAMLFNLLLGVIIANIPGVTITQLFLFYGTFRASTCFPTILTLLNKKLYSRAVNIGVIVSMCIGLPIFAIGNLYKIVPLIITGSLFSLFASGIIAIIWTNINIMKNKKDGVCAV